MNLLEKAKVITTPTAYSDGFLHSVKPNVLENLLLQSNQFDTTWANTSLSFTSGQTGYDGSSDAWLINRVDINSSLRQTPPIDSVATFSFYAKANDLNWVRIRTGSVQNSYFDLSSGSIGFTQNIIDASIEDIGNGWYRCITTAIGYDRFYIYPAVDNQDVSGTSGSIYIQDAQLNKGLTADQYIETTTETSPRADFTFTRNSSATRVGEDGYIQDVQIIGGELVQNGDFEEIGSELVTNGSFDTDTNWVKGTGWTISGGTANANVGNDVRLYQSGIGLQVGKTYLLKFDVLNYVSGGFRGFLGYTQSDGFIYATSNGSFEIFITPSNVSQDFVRFHSVGTFVGSIDNVSVKEVGQNWSFGTGWTMGDGKAVVDGTNTFLQQASTIEQSTLYRIGFTLSDYVSGNFRIALGGYVIGDVYNANGTYTADVISDASSNTVIYFYAQNASDFAVDNISVKKITDDTNLPRINYEGFDYDNGLPIYGSGKGHLLLEGQSTNLVTYSEDFSGYTLQDSTSTSNAAISPDGTQNATLIESTTNLSSFISDPTVSITIGNTYTFSVFAKKGNNNWIRIAHVSSAATAAWFDLENGVVGTVNSISATIEDYGNGWYRCTNTFVASTDTATVLIFVGICDDDNSTSAGAIGQNDYIWGWQLEQGNISSYIPTNGTTVTRSAETCNNAGNVDLFDSEGVLYADIAALANDGTNRMISISDGTNANRITLYYSSITNQIAVIIKQSAITSYQEYYSALSNLDYHKIAIRYKDNDFSFWINGVQVGTGLSGIVPSGLKQLAFDYGDNLNFPFYGKTKMVGVFPYLSNDEMECLTGEGYGTFQAMALANNYTIIQG